MAKSKGKLRERGSIDIRIRQKGKQGGYKGEGKRGCERVREMKIEGRNEEEKENVRSVERQL